MHGDGLMKEAGDRLDRLSMHIIVDQDDWRRVQPLIYDGNGKYQPEVGNVETHWNGPFHIWLYMPEGQPLIDLMEEEDIPYSNARR